MVASKLVALALLPAPEEVDLCVARRLKGRLQMQGGHCTPFAAEQRGAMNLQPAELSVAKAQRVQHVGIHVVASVQVSEIEATELVLSVEHSAAKLS